MGDRAGLMTSSLKCAWVHVWDSLTHPVLTKLSQYRITNSLKMRSVRVNPDDENGARPSTSGAPKANAKSSLCRVTASLTPFPTDARVMHTTNTRNSQQYHSSTKALKITTNCTCRAKKVDGHDKIFSSALSRTCVPTFKFVPVPLFRLLSRHRNRLVGLPFWSCRPTIVPDVSQLSNVYGVWRHFTVKVIVGHFR